MVIINLWPGIVVIVEQSGTALCELVCLPNCTLLAGFRVLLVSAFASYLAWLLIFFGIWGPNILIVTGFIIVTRNVNSLGKLATQLKLLLRPESLARGIF